MRFLVDESVGVSITQHLRDAGYDVVAITETSPGTQDTDVLSQATSEQRILITNDKDFGELIFRSSRSHCGVLLFRLRDESATNDVRILKAVLSTYSSELPGRFVIVSEKAVRIRG